MKHTKKLLTLTISLFICSLASAQANFQQHQRQMQMHNQAVQTHIRMHQQFMNTTMMNHMNRPTTKTSGKYKFNIVMLNGDTIRNKKIKISYMEPLKEIVLKDKKETQKFTPNQTKEIFIGKGKKAMRGIQHDDYWIFNTYSLPSVDFYAPFPDKDISYITYFQQKGDSIRVLTNENLQEIVKDHPKALKDAKKNDSKTALFRYIREEKWK